jgi:hypothetical protein
MCDVFIYNWDDLDDANSVSMSILGFDGDDLRQAREDALINASQAPLFSSNYKTKTAAAYPHVYQSGQTGGTLSLFGSRYALPAGTVREEFNDYEETTIPVPKKAPVRVGERRILISEMDSLARGAFKVRTGLYKKVIKYLKLVDDRHMKV